MHVFKDLMWRWFLIFFFIEAWLTGTSVVRMHDRWRERQGRPGDSDVPLKPGLQFRPRDLAVSPYVHCWDAMGEGDATPTATGGGRGIRNRRQPRVVVVWRAPVPCAWSLEWNGSSRPNASPKAAAAAGQSPSTHPHRGTGPCRAGAIGERAPLPAGGRGGGDPFRFRRGPGRIGWNWNWVRVTDGRSWWMVVHRLTTCFWTVAGGHAKTLQQQSPERRGSASCTGRWGGGRACTAGVDFPSLPPSLRVPYYGRQRARGPARPPHVTSTTDQGAWDPRRAFSLSLPGRARACARPCLGPSTKKKNYKIFHILCNFTTHISNIKYR